MKKDQPDLFPPFARGSDTSEAAAESVAELTGRLRTAVYRFIVDNDGASCDHIEQALNLRHQTASARVNELMRQGWIIDSGERPLTRSGRKAVLWKKNDRRGRV